MTQKCDRLLRNKQPGISGNLITTLKKTRHVNPLKKIHLGWDTCPDFLVYGGIKEIASESKHAGLNAWIKEVADLCTPEEVYWCDGSYV